MIWSISSDKMFNRCQRQWYYKQIFGNANARKDNERYETYLLSKLQSISSLRGHAVDEAISELAVPAFNKQRSVTKQGLLDFAVSRFEAKLKFAKEHQFKRRLKNPAKLPDHFAMLFDREYGNAVNAEEFDRAFSEIETAIENFFTIDQLVDTLRRSNRIVSQRALMWKVGANTVRAVPDAIAFYEHDPPIVFDWKVHYFGNADAGRQLASYAIALDRAKPHRDFPFSADRWPETETRLMEVQLLRGEVREHQYSEFQFEELENWIYRRVNETAAAVGGRSKSSDFRPQDFSTAYSGRQCEVCNFKRICWKEFS